MTDVIDPEDEPILDIAQAGRILRRDEALLRRWIAAKLIPTTRQQTGHKKHMLSYRTLKMIEAMPRAKGYKPPAPRQTTVTRQSDGTTRTITVPGTTQTKEG